MIRKETLQTMCTRNTNNQIKDNQWASDFSYLVDVTRYLKELNLKLRIQEGLMHEPYRPTNAFFSKKDCRPVIFVSPMNADVNKAPENLPITELQMI